MKAHNGLSQADKLVLALARLEQRCKCYVSVAGLAVEAWKADPRTWGLSGYEREYVDSNRVIACLSVRTGPVKRGLIERPIRGLAVVRLTPAGRAAARQIEQRAALAGGVT